MNVFLDPYIGAEGTLFIVVLLLHQLLFTSYFLVDEGEGVVSLGYLLATSLVALITASLSRTIAFSLLALFESLVGGMPENPVSASIVSATIYVLCYSLATSIAVAALYKKIRRVYEEKVEWLDERVRLRAANAVAEQKAKVIFRNREDG